MPCIAAASIDITPCPGALYCRLVFDIAEPRPPKLHFSALCTSFPGALQFRPLAPQPAQHQLVAIGRHIGQGPPASHRAPAPAPARPASGRPLPPRRTPPPGRAPRFPPPRPGWCVPRRASPRSWGPAGSTTGRPDRRTGPAPPRRSPHPPPVMASSTAKSTAPVRSRNAIRPPSPRPWPDANSWTTTADRSPRRSGSRPRIRSASPASGSGRRSGSRSR